MRVVAVVFVVIGLTCLTGFAETFQGKGMASGNVVLWFSGTSVTATFDGTFALTGQLVLDGESTAFAATGWARGEGDGDTSTLDVEAWATFVARGETDAGEALSVQGGITLSSVSPDASGSAGSGTGAFFATVFLADQRYHAQGSVEGSASGEFAIPEDPLSMELAGDGTFDLSGDLTLVPPTQPNDAMAGPDDPSVESQDDKALLDVLPWDLDSWPDDLVSQLLDILTCTAPAETAEVVPAASE